jgi:hypothetical protein
MSLPRLDMGAHLLVNELTRLARFPQHEESNQAHERQRDGAEYGCSLYRAGAFAPESLRPGHRLTLLPGELLLLLLLLPDRWLYVALGGQHLRVAGEGGLAVLCLLLRLLLLLLGLRALGLLGFSATGPVAWCLSA